MSVLENYPNLSQRAAKINGPDDCVPTSIIDGLEYLTGQQFDIDAMVAAAYGPNYTGFTSASQFVPFCAQHGVKLYPLDGDNAALVQDLHQQIEALHPCLLTEPDPYAPLHPNWSHVLSIYKEEPGTLTARDPYSTIDVTHSDTEWASLLQFREIWILERINDMPPPLTLTNPEAAKHFGQISDTQWRCKTTGKLLKDGMLKYYQSCSANPLQGLHDLGLPVSNEILLDNKGNTRQHFERAVLFYDPSKVYDNPPGSGPVYVAKIYSGQGQDPEIADLQKQLDQLKQVPQMPQMEADIKQAKEIFAKY